MCIGRFRLLRQRRRWILPEGVSENSGDIKLRSGGYISEDNMSVLYAMLRVTSYLSDSGACTSARCWKSDKAVCALWRLCIRSEQA
jgi:hypothetical protein